MRGVGPRRRLAVDGQIINGCIKGFDYEPGYRNAIRMERFDPLPKRRDRFQESSKYGYRLIEILEKAQEP